MISIILRLQHAEEGEGQDQDELWECPGDNYIQHRVNFYFFIVFI